MHVAVSLFCICHSKQTQNLLSALKRLCICMGVGGYVSMPAEVHKYALEHVILKIFSKVVCYQHI